MPEWSIRARPPQGGQADITIVRDPDVLASFLEDAAHFPGGHASGLIVAASEAGVAQALRTSPA